MRAVPVERLDVVYVQHVNYVVMGKRNLTVQIDEDLIRRVRVVAAERGPSVSGLVRQQLEDLASDGLGYERARDKALRYLHEPPFRLGGRRVKRAALYDRKGLRRQ